MYCIGYCTSCIFLYENNTWLPSWSSGVPGPCWAQSLGKGSLCPGVGNAHAPWTAGVTTKEIDGALVLGTNVLGTKSAKKRHKNWAAPMKSLPISLNDFRPADSVCVSVCTDAVLQRCYRTWRQCRLPLSGNAPIANQPLRHSLCRVP